jgi:cysteine desulfurase
MRRIYLDYASTTPLDPRVLESMMPYLTEKYGNAESISTFGMDARMALEESRAKVARFMNAEISEIIFTGSATEANNMVLKCHAFQYGKEKTHIVVSSIEHICVLNTVKWLEKMGYRVTYIPVDKYGIVDLKYFEKTLRDGVSLVSVIHGNNEIGTIEPIEEIGKLCNEFDTLFHTDAAQTFGKLPIDVRSMNIGMMTVNAHKIYGPKGVGALYINKDIRLDALLHGGEHEFGMRGGTHNIPGIVGFAKAVDIRKEEMEAETRKLLVLKKKLIEGSLGIDGVHLNGHPTKRLANNINLRFLYIDGESLVLQLDLEGIATSSASACSSRTEEASHVLIALGLDPVESKGSLRMSLGKYNSESDVEYILEILPKVVKKLRKISPLAPQKFRED